MFKLAAMLWTHPLTVDAQITLMDALKGGFEYEETAEMRRARIEVAMNGELRVSIFSFQKTIFSIRQNRTNEWQGKDVGAVRTVVSTSDGEVIAKLDHHQGDYVV